MLEELNNNGNVELVANVNILIQEQSLPDTHLSKHRFKQQTAYYFMVFWCIWLLYGFCFLIFNATLYSPNDGKNTQPQAPGQPQHELKSYYVYLYIVLLFGTFLFKTLLKRIANKIDQLRIKFIIFSNNFNVNQYGNNSNLQLFSIEWVCEVIMWLFYSGLYCNLIIYFNNELEWSQLFISIIIHFGIQIYQSVIKMSKFYFDKMINVNNSKCGMLESRFTIDDSRYHQWMLRLSIDVNLQFYSSFIVSLWCIIYIICVVQLNQRWSNDQTLNTVGFISVLLSCDILYFVLSCLVFYQREKICLFTMFDRVWEYHKIYFLVAWICGVQFVFPLVF